MKSIALILLLNIVVYKNLIATESIQIATMPLRYNTPKLQDHMYIPVEWTYETTSSNVTFNIYWSWSGYYGQNRQWTKTNVSSPNSEYLKWGQYSVYVRMLYPNGSYLQSETRSFTIYISPYIYADNNFIDILGTHGKLKVSGFTEDQTAPFECTKYVGDEIILTAIPNQKNNEGNTMLWRPDSRWTKNGSIVSWETTVSEVLENNDFNNQYKAIFFKLCQVTFKNYFPGTSKYGQIKHAGILYSEPKIEDVIESQSSSIAEVITPQEIDYVIYFFSKWNDNTTGSQSYVYNVSGNVTREAIFYGKAIFPESIRCLTFTKDNFNHIVLHWNDHPNTNVTQYQIWRRVKHDGVWNEPQLLGYRSRGTTTYTDQSYIRVPDNSGDELWYDIRAYFAPSATWGNEQWGPAVFGEYSGGNQNDKKVADEIRDIVITDYDLFNYPNPFNPLTVIEYHLPKAVFVEILVYNSMGKRVANLVNEYKDAGKYKVNFNGTDFASGIYFLCLQTDGRTIVRKLLLLK